MSFFRRSNHHADDLDDEHANIDDDLRLRTVRTAASTLAESILTEERAERRRRSRRKRARFFKKSDKEKDREKRPSTADDASLAPSTATTTDAPRSAVIPGARRNIYVNTPLTAIEVDRNGEPLARYVRNKIRTSSAYHPCCILSTALTIVSAQSTHFSHFFPRTCSSNSDGTCTLSFLAALASFFTQKHREPLLPLPRRRAGYVSIFPIVSEATTAFLAAISACTVRAVSSHGHCSSQCSRTLHPVCGRRPQPRISCAA
jgi:hypothetical protein